MSFQVTNHIILVPTGNKKTVLESEIELIEHELLDQVSQDATFYGNKKTLDESGQAYADFDTYSYSSEETIEELLVNFTKEHPYFARYCCEREDVSFGEYLIKDGNRDYASGFVRYEGHTMFKWPYDD